MSRICLRIWLLWLIMGWTRKVWLKIIRLKGRIRSIIRKCLKIGTNRIRVGIVLAPRKIRMISPTKVVRWRKRVVFGFIESIDLFDGIGTPISYMIRIIAFITHRLGSLVHLIRWENVIEFFNHCVDLSFQSKRRSYRVCARSWVNRFFVRTFPLGRLFSKVFKKLPSIVMMLGKKIALAHWFEHGSWAVFESIV